MYQLATVPDVSYCDSETIFSSYVITCFRVAYSLEKNMTLDLAFSTLDYPSVSNLGRYLRSIVTYIVYS